jgi:hypothetical protein
VHTDANDVSGLNALWHNLFQRLIDEDGITRLNGGGCGKHEQPSRRDDGRAKRIVAGVDQVNLHRKQPFLVQEEWVQ